MPSKKFPFLIKISFRISLKFILISRPLYPNSPMLSVTLDIFFSSGITLSFFPQRCSFCLDLPPSACYPHLHHQPLILNSSSHRSQPKRTSLEVFHDYPSSEVSQVPPFLCPHNTLYFTLVMKCLCSLREGSYLSSSPPFPQHSAVFTQQVLHKFLLKE